MFQEVGWFSQHRLFVIHKTNLYRVPVGGTEGTEVTASDRRRRNLKASKKREHTGCSAALC